MLFNRLSSLFFFISMLVTIMLIGDFRLSFISFEVFFYIGFIVTGILGFTFGFLSIFFDKKRVNKKPLHLKEHQLFFYVAMMVIYAGLTLRILRHPYNTHLIIIGALLMTAVYLWAWIGGNKKRYEGDEDLLDQ